MSLQQKAYQRVPKHQKCEIPQIIKNEIQLLAAIKIQKWYRQHLYFMTWCKYLYFNCPISKKLLVECVFYGLHVDAKFVPRLFRSYQYAHELRHVMHKLSQIILYYPQFQITGLQVKQILKCLTKDQLHLIGFGLDKTRI